MPTTPFPSGATWRLLTRAPALALRGRVLLLAAVGMLATGGGDLLLLGDVTKPPVAGEWGASDLPMVSWQRLSTAWLAFADPFLALAEGDPIAPNLVRALGRIVVWGIIGGAILRIAALALTRGEAPSATSALRFAWHHRKGSLGGPVLLVGGLAMVAAPLGLVRLAMQVSWLAPVGAVLWPLLLLAAAVASFYALGMAIGWPLVGSAAATDQSDGFDAVSRMFAYVFQKPLRLIGYVVVTLALGLLAGMAIECFLAAVLLVSRWSVGTDPLATTAAMVAWWESAMVALTSLFFTTYLWTSAAAIYLLRRQDIDDVPIDEVFLEPAEGGGESRKLPTGTTSGPEAATEQAA